MATFKGLVTSGRTNERGATLVGTLVALIILGIALTVGFNALTTNQRVSRDNLKVVRMQGLVEGLTAAQAARRDITPHDETIYVTATGITTTDPGGNALVDSFKFTSATSVQAAGDVKVVGILTDGKTSRSVGSVAYFHS